MNGRGWSARVAHVPRGRRQVRESHLRLLVPVALAVLATSVASTPVSARNTSARPSGRSEVVTPSKVGEGEGHLIGESGVTGTQADRLTLPTPRNGHAATKPPPSEGGHVSRGGPSTGSPDSAAAASTKFAGMSQTASGYGAGFPPDSTIARGSDRVLHLVNRRAKLLDSTGGVFAVTDLNRFFGATSNGVPVGEALFDPKVIYDRGSQTYFAVALQGQTASASNFYLAVSRPASPTSFAASQWCRYVFDARILFGGASTWADYPGLGVGRNTLILTTNQYSTTFEGGVIRAWSKNYFANNYSSCPAWKAPYLWTGYGPSQATRLPDTLQPALHYTNPTGVTPATQPAYLIDTVGGGSTQYRVWKIANLASGSPSLFGPASLSGSSNNREPDRLAPGSLSNVGIDTGDTRMLQVAGRGDALHAVHNVRCQFGGGENEVCVRYIQLSVGNTSNGGITTSVAQQSVLGGGDGWYYTFPSIAVNNSGAAATAFNAVQVGGYRGSAWAAKTPTASQFSSVSWLAQGTCLLDATYDSRKGFYRAGDYSGAAADPDLSSIWVTSERSVNITGVGCGWQTHIARITGI